MVIVFIGIQFFRPGKNRAAGTVSQDISSIYTVPAPVLKILKRSCYDCHSNNTQYPWYHQVQPVAWILDHHIEEGKRELNFSTFATYTPKKSAHKLDEIITETGEREMPLPSYVRIHRNAVLSDQEIDLIIVWAKALSDSISKANHLP